jgi:hypothetical protein
VNEKIALEEKRSGDETRLWAVITTLLLVVFASAVEFPPSVALDPTLASNGPIRVEGASVVEVPNMPAGVRLSWVLEK